MRDDRRGERGPTRLVRGAKPLARVAVEILIEQRAVSPCGVALEERVCAMLGPSSLRVGQEEPEKAPLEFVCHLAEVRAVARASRQLDGEIVAQPAMESSQRLDRQEVEWEPDWTAPVRIAAELRRRRFRRFIVETHLCAVQIKHERMILVEARERAQPERRQELLLVEH